MHQDKKITLVVLSYNSLLVACSVEGVSPVYTMHEEPIPAFSEEVLADCLFSD